MRAALLALCLVACTDKAVAPYPLSAPPIAADAALGPGDLFEVRVFGEPTLSATYEVAQDGSINFPLIGQVKVQGRTPVDLQLELETRLADGFIKHPSVSVRVTEYRSRKVVVFGQVKTPGTFVYAENMSVVEAITRAGGFTGMARKNGVRITRLHAGETEKIIVAVEDIGTGRAPNFLLRPGDVVFVPERMF